MLTIRRATAEDCPLIRAMGFYERMGMRRLREGDFPIGGGYYMNDYIMGLEIE